LKLGEPEDFVVSEGLSCIDTYVKFERPARSRAGRKDARVERFVSTQRDEDVPRELRDVLNWFDELERLVPRE
jgi:hypothetical protein